MSNHENPSEDEVNVAVRPDYDQELIEIVKSNISPKALEDRLSDYHENDIASALENLTREERLKIYRVLDADTLANVFEYADDVKQYLNELTMRKRVDILAKMEPAIAADYLKTLPKEERATLLDLLPADSAQDISLALSFDEDEIGSVMTTNYIAVTNDLSIKEAMHSLVEQAADNDNISTIYVVDKNGLYYGAIDLKDLIITRDTQPLSSIIATSYPYFYAHELINDCIEQIKEYSEDSIPILNEQNQLLGVITAQDFIQVMDDEMSEDYVKLAGLSVEEDLHEPVTESVKKRLPWLLILMALGLVVSAVIGVFENVISQLTLIMCFQSLILDMAGNVGTQSLAVTIRVLTDEQLSGKDKLGLVFKESRVGILNGLILGIASFAVAGVYIWLCKGQSPANAFAISGCIGAAMLISMLLSSLVGTVIPLFFKKIHIDPAVASGPLITTLNDLVAVVAYYGLAWILLINVLHM